MNNSRIGSAMAAVVALLAGSASASLVTFTMVNGDDGGMPFNTVFFTVTNNCPGVTLDTWSMTVGDTGFLYDQLYLRREAFAGGDGTQAASLLLGDRTDDEVGPDSFSYGFQNLGTGVTFAGQWDIDIDDGNFDVDARRVLFNNGAAPNAVASFFFSDGSQVVYTFPDLPILDSYALSIPGPGVLMPAVVCCGLAGLRRRASR